MIPSSAKNYVFRGQGQTDGLLARNWLRRSQGNAIHTMLCGTGYNLRLILAHLRVLCLALIVLPGYATKSLRAA